MIRLIETLTCSEYVALKCAVMEVMGHRDDMIKDHRYTKDIRDVAKQQLDQYDALLKKLGAFEEV